MRKQLWLGCLVCVLAVLPGTLLGGLADILYRVVTEFEITADLNRIDEFSIRR
jgi:hypothetical protein